MSSLASNILTLVDVTTSSDKEFHIIRLLLFDRTKVQNKLVPWGTDGRLPLSDLHLDLGSGHTAYRRASLITHRPLPTYQISLRSEEKNFSVTTEVLVKFRVT